MAGIPHPDPCLCCGIAPHTSSEDCLLEKRLRKGLIDRLNRTRALSATDPRDKGFALFGIPDACGIRLDEPEYIESATAAKLFRKFTYSITEWQTSLDILIEVSIPALTDAPHGLLIGVDHVFGEMSIDTSLLSPSSATALSKLPGRCWTR
jgi:hypothetical protein